jgi:hypothetical protein
VPVDDPLKAEQSIFAHMLGSEGDGEMVPKAIDFGNQLYLSGNIPDQLQIIIQTLFLLWEPLRERSV